MLCGAYLDSMQDGVDATCCHTHEIHRPAPSVALRCRLKSCLVFNIDCCEKSKGIGGAVKQWKANKQLGKERKALRRMLFAGKIALFICSIYAGLDVRCDELNITRLLDTSGIRHSSHRLGVNYRVITS